MSSYTYSTLGGGYVQFKVECENDNCPAQPTVDWHYWSEAEAAEAWNTRAERTCRKLPADTECVCIVRNHGLVREFGYWKCSECGANCFEGARYCMGCGAKVVDE